MLTLVTFAAIEPGVIAVMIPIVALTIPIVAILTAHQRKMAEIINRPGSTEAVDEIRALRSEIRELRQRVDDLTLAVDSNSLRHLDPTRFDVHQR
ncbi:MAG: hypothetical protein ACK4XJ_05920 [Fimbriimonadaceae bacterium]